MFSQHQFGLLQAHVGGMHDFVSRALLQESVLMDAGFVREGIFADDGFVALNVNAGERRNQARRRDDALGIDFRVIAAEKILARAQRHYDFFERRIPRALADAVDRTFDLARAVLHAGETVRDGQSQIVVAVHGDDRLLDVRNFRDQRVNDRAVLVGHGVADGVRNVDGRRAGFDGGFDDFAQKFRLRSAGVFWTEFDVLAKFARHLHGVNGLAHDFVFRFLQFEFAVNRAGGEKDMDARPFRVLHRVARGFDVFLQAARQPRDDGAVEFFGDGFDGVEIAGRGDGEAGFDDVHLQPRERAGDLQFFFAVHAGAGRLLAIAQSRVEDVDAAIVSWRRRLACMLV